MAWKVFVTFLLLSGASLSLSPGVRAQQHGLGLAAGPSGVAVIGEVATPGVQPISAGLTLKGALTAAGGLNAGADLHHLLLRRLGAAQFADVDGEKALTGDPLADAPLQAGDTVIVPRNGAALYYAVLGEVAQPVIDLCPTTPVPAKSVIDGALTKDSDRDHLLIVQGLLTDPATAKTLTVKEADLGGMTLGPGDVVLVGRRSGGSGGLGDLVKKALGVVTTHFFAAQTMPMTAEAANTQEKVGVVGEVFNPRLYFYGPGMTVKDALEQASGLTLRADTAHLVLRRTGDADTLIPIDAAKALAGDPDQNKTLQPGDTLYVPRLPRADMYAVFGAVKTPTVAGLTAATPPTVRAALDAAGLDGADKTQIVVIHGLLSDPATARVETVAYDQAAAHQVAAGDLLLPSRQKSGWSDQITQIIANLRGKAAQYLSVVNNIKSNINGPTPPAAVVQK